MTVTYDTDYDKRMNTNPTNYLKTEKGLSVSQFKKADKVFNIIKFDIFENTKGKSKAIHNVFILDERNDNVFAFRAGEDVTTAYATTFIWNRFKIQTPNLRRINEQQGKWNFLTQINLEGNKTMTNKKTTAATEASTATLNSNSTFKQFVESKGKQFKGMKQSDKEYKNLKAQFDKFISDLKTNESTEKSKPQVEAKKTATKKVAAESKAKVAEKKEVEAKAEVIIEEAKKKRVSTTLEPSLAKREAELKEVDQDIEAMDITIKTFEESYKGVYNAWCDFENEATERPSNEKIYARLEEASGLIDDIFEELKAHRKTLIEGRKAIERLVAVHQPKKAKRTEEAEIVETPKAAEKAHATSSAIAEKTLEKQQDPEVLKLKAKKANEFVTIFVPELKKNKQRVLDIQKATVKRTAFIKLTKGRSIEVNGNGWIYLNTMIDNKPMKKAYTVKKATEIFADLKA